MTPRVSMFTVSAALAAVVAVAGATASGRQPAARGGTTITTRVTAANGSGGSQSVTTLLTLFLQADRKRQESRSEATLQTPGAHSALITRCDPRELIFADVGEREYTVTRLPASSPLAAHRTTPPRPLQSPNLIIETTTTDTGERKPMFGHQARRVITTERRIPLDPAVADAGETVIDAWYIDLDTRVSCERQPTTGSGYLFAVNVQQGSPPPVISFRDVGPRETGYVVTSTRTSRSRERLPDGTTSEGGFTVREEVTSITEGPLDPELFEAPVGFLDVSPGSWGYYWKVGRQWLARTLQRWSRS